MNLNQNHYCCEGKKRSKDPVIVWKAISGVLAVIVLIFTAVSISNIEFKNETLSKLIPSFMQEQDDLEDIVVKIIPTGIPAVYGSELDIKYDDVSSQDPFSTNEAIEKMAQFDIDIELSDNELNRYIDILYNHHGGMSCEYCCDAPSIIFENGEMACGCAHSFAMRGVTKYLITKHGDSMTDEEILKEIGKWKVRFFPDIHIQKSMTMMDMGIEVDHISLTTNQNRGVEKGGSGDMVGSC